MDGPIHQQEGNEDGKVFDLLEFEFRLNCISDLILENIS